MAETDAPQGDAEATTDNTSQNEAPKETDWKAEARKWESRAKESFAAAKANEDAAKRLAEIEEAQKTEAQKQQEALERAQKELADVTAAKVRAEVAAAKGVPAALLNGSTQEELEASADALIAFRGEAAKPSVAAVLDNANKASVGVDYAGAIAQATQDRNFALVATLKQQQAAEQSKGTS